MDTVFSRLTKENTKEKIFILLFWQMKSPHTIYWVFIYLIYLISGNIYIKEKKNSLLLMRFGYAENWENWKSQKKTIKKKLVG